MRVGFGALGCSSDVVERSFSHESLDCPCEDSRNIRGEAVSFDQ